MIDSEGPENIPITGQLLKCIKLYLIKILENEIRKNKNVLSKY